MAAFLGDGSLTLPPSRNMLSITQMYLTIMKNASVSCRAMYSKEKSCSGGPKVPQSSQKGECTTLVFYSAVQEKKQNDKTRSYSENR